MPVCRLYEDYTAIITEYRSCLLNVIEFFEYFHCNLLNNAIICCLKKRFDNIVIILDLEQTAS